MDNLHICLSQYAFIKIKYAKKTTTVVVKFSYYCKTIAHWIIYKEQQLLQTASFEIVFGRSVTPCFLQCTAWPIICNTVEEDTFSAKKNMYLHVTVNVVAQINYYYLLIADVNHQWSMLFCDLWGIQMSMSGNAKCAP